MSNKEKIINLFGQLIQNLNDLQVEESEVFSGAIMFLVFTLKSSSEPIKHAYSQAFRDLSNLIENNANFNTDDLSDIFLNLSEKKNSFYENLNKIKKRR